MLSFDEYWNSWLMKINKQVGQRRINVQCLFVVIMYSCKLYQWNSQTFHVIFRFLAYGTWFIHFTYLLKICNKKSHWNKYDIPLFVIICLLSCFLNHVLKLLTSGYDIRICSSISSFYWYCQNRKLSEKCVDSRSLHQPYFWQYQQKSCWLWINFDSFTITVDFH
jgi:hypothetical protein